MKHSQSQFKSAKLRRVPRSRWNQSHSYFTTQGYNEILPYNWAKLNPGGKYDMTTCSVALTQAMFAPTFSRMTLKNRTFAVPIRKLVPWWDQYVTSDPNDEWKEPYMTVGDMIGITNYQGSSPVYSYMSTGPNSLGERLGLPDFSQALWRLAVNESQIIVQDDDQVWAYIEYNNNVVFALTEENGFPNDNPHSFPVTDPRYKLSFEFTDLGYTNLVTAIREGLGRKSTGSIDAFLSTPINLLSFFAYQKLYYDWFADVRFTPDYSELFFEWMSDPVRYSRKSPTAFMLDPRISPDLLFHYLDDDNTMSLGEYIFRIRNVGMPKDMFTTCSDGQQAGPQIALSLFDKLDLYAKIIQDPVDLDNPLVAGKKFTASDPAVQGKEYKLDALARNGSPYEDYGEVYAKVNEGEILTATKLRWQMALQKFQEASNIGGRSRYTDFVFGHYGVRIPEPYLLRSVYVGGNSVDIKVKRVVAQADGTADKSSSSVLGDLGGIGDAANMGPQLRARIAHDYVIMMSVSYIVPDTYYYQGLSRKFTDISLLSSWIFPEFAHVGEEEVKKREVVFGENSNDTFGWQRRYYDKTSSLDEVHGDFRESLRFWLTGRHYSNTPALGKSFIERGSLEGSERVFVYTNSADPNTGTEYRPFVIRYDLIGSHVLPIPGNIGVGRIS